MSTQLTSFGAGMITGLSFYFGSGRGADDDLDYRMATRFGIGGLLVGAGVVLGVGVGLPLLLASGTHYEIVEQRAWLDVQPDGIRVTF